MLRDEINDLLDKEPFEPFRIKLLIGDMHDVNDPLSVAVQQLTVTIVSRDQHWVLFPLRSINSIESLLPDFPFEPKDDSES